MVFVKILQIRSQELIERKLKLEPEDFDRPMDLYEMVATKLGWKGDMDPLWFLSNKSVLRIFRVENFTCNQEENIL